MVKCVNPTASALFLYRFIFIIFKNAFLLLLLLLRVLFRPHTEISEVNRNIQYIVYKKATQSSQKKKKSILHLNRNPSFQPPVKRQNSAHCLRNEKDANIMKCFSMQWINNRKKNRNKRFEEHLFKMSNPFFFAAAAAGFVSSWHSAS